MDHNEYQEVLKMGMAIAADQFSEIELAICKGKRLAIENVVDWLNVCVQSARKDLEKTGDAVGVLETTLNAMEFMKEEYKKKLASDVKLISKSVMGK